MNKNNEKILTKEAKKILEIDANLLGELQKNIEEQKLIQKMNKISQKFFNSHHFKKPIATKAKTEKTKEESLFVSKKS